MRVVDTTAPALTLPADFTIDVFDPKGLSANYLVTATDAVDPAPVVVCTPPSGTLPPPGKTTVECTATDAAGNSSAGSFVMTMLDARQTIALMREQVIAMDVTPRARDACWTASTTPTGRWRRTTGEAPARRSTAWSTYVERNRSGDRVGVQPPCVCRPAHGRPFSRTTRWPR